VHEGGLRLITVPYFGGFSFLNPSSPSPFPNDLRRNPLNMRTPTRAIATIVFPIGTLSNNAVTKEIAAPTMLNGNHFLITIDDLTKFRT
jgi:hypothetical protein